jgi:mono/diheme cytochrome c family protein
MLIRFAVASLVVVGALACGGAPIAKDKITGDDAGALLWNGYANKEANCFHCHGGDLKGSMLGPDLTTIVPHMSDAGIVEVITNGKPKTIMEAYKGKLTDAEINTLATWLRKELPGAAEAAPAAAPAPAPAAAPGAK